MGKAKEQRKVVGEQAGAGERLEAGDKVALFVHKRRKVLLPLVIIVAAGVVLSVAFFLIRGAMEKKAIAKVEAFELRRTELGEDTGASADTDALLAELNDFAPSTFGYAAARSYSLIADIHFSRSQWKEAEENWALAAGKAPKIYLSSVSFFNAAIAAEEQGNKDAAIDYFNKSLAATGSYPAAARARFNIARIHEAQNDKDKASAAYRDLIEKSPNSPWANLAHNRLIVLEKN